MKLPYSNPKLVKYEDLAKTWYVYFRYNGKVFKYTGKMGYEPNKRKRTLMGEALASILLEKLKDGWNPLVKDDIAHNSYTLYDAIEFAFEKKKPNLSDKTIKGYGCFMRFMHADIPQAGYSFILKLQNSNAHKLKRF